MSKTSWRMKFTFRWTSNSLLPHSTCTITSGEASWHVTTAKQALELIVAALCLALCLPVVDCRQKYSHYPSYPTGQLYMPVVGGMPVDSAPPLVPMQGMPMVVYPTEPKMRYIAHQVVDSVGDMAHKAKNKIKSKYKERRNRRHAKKGRLDERILPSSQPTVAQNPSASQHFPESQVVQAPSYGAPPVAGEHLSGLEYSSSEAVRAAEHRQQSLESPVTHESNRVNLQGNNREQHSQESRVHQQQSQYQQQHIQQQPPLQPQPQPQQQQIQAESQPQSQPQPEPLPQQQPPIQQSQSHPSEQYLTNEPETASSSLLSELRSRIASMHKELDSMSRLLESLADNSKLASSIHRFSTVESVKPDATNNVQETKSNHKMEQLTNRSVRVTKEVHRATETNSVPSVESYSVSSHSNEERSTTVGSSVASSSRESTSNGIIPSLQPISEIIPSLTSPYQVQIGSNSQQATTNQVPLSEALSNQVLPDKVVSPNQMIADDSQQTTLSDTQSSCPDAGRDAMDIPAQPTGLRRNRKRSKLIRATRKGIEAALEVTDKISSATSRIRPQRALGRPEQSDYYSKKVRKERGGRLSRGHRNLRRRSFSKKTRASQPSSGFKLVRAVPDMLGSYPIIPPS